MSRPRVTASHEIESLSHKAMCDTSRYVSPSVVVEVSFDLHDHAAALAALESAVQRVREQIEETR